jgi:soluble lytic murein transglycosylase
MMRAGIWICIGLMVLLAVAAGLWLSSRASKYDEIIALTAANYGVDFYLVKALVYEESWFRADIRGASGELGLMQVTLGAAEDFSTYKGFPPVSEARLLEPRLNVEIGCWYLKQSLERYKNSPAPTLFALLRYNAGEARADQWLRLARANPVPAGMDPEQHYLSLVDFPTTREYVRRILRRTNSRNYWF